MIAPSEPARSTCRRRCCCESFDRKGGRGITQLKEFVRELGAPLPEETVTRFETAPGSQLQIEFVKFRRAVLPLRAFAAELSFSRYSYVEFASNEADRL
jgi:transposase